MNESPTRERLLSPRATPTTLTEDYASVFGLTKQQLVSMTPDDRMAQVGGAYIGDRFEIPDLSARFPELSEPIIETFTVDATGACSPTGVDTALIDAVTPLVEAMARRTLDALHQFDVDVAAPGYLTASVSPIDQVTDLAHLDDDQYVPGDGVGAVSIAGDGNGTRLAINPIPHATLRPHLPVEIPERFVDGFGAGEVRLQQAAPDRIVVFPQFGQLHSGPPPAILDKAVLDKAVLDKAVLDKARTVRTLLVFRLTTKPQPTGPKPT